MGGQEITLVGALAAAVLGFVTGLVVPGPLYRDMLRRADEREARITKERDEFAEVASEAVALSNRLVGR